MCCLFCTLHSTVFILYICIYTHYTYLYVDLCWQMLEAAVLVDLFLYWHAFIVFFACFCMCAAVSGVVRQRVEDNRREKRVRRGRWRGPRQVQHLDGWRQTHHMCSQECCSGERFVWKGVFMFWTQRSEAAVCLLCCCVASAECVIKRVWTVWMWICLVLRLYR